MKIRKPKGSKSRVGKWAGLPAPIIAELMDCSVSTAKNRLYKLAKSIPIAKITKKDIGNLIYEYKEEQVRFTLNGYFS